MKKKKDLQTACSPEHALYLKKIKKTTVFVDTFAIAEKFMKTMMRYVDL